MNKIDEMKKEYYSFCCKSGSYKVEKFFKDQEEEDKYTECWHPFDIVNYAWYSIEYLDSDFIF